MKLLEDDEVFVSFSACVQTFILGLRGYHL